MNTGEYLLQLDSITYRAGGRDILSNVSLTVSNDKILTVIGPNGAGKSTLVRVMLGLLKPQSGKVRRKKGLRIGYMPQRLVV
ncbi:MAG: zinc transport system ATP-binding protein, partial [Gammaproteobacteria bacterium]